ncbi:MAG TPA: CpsD/CapB family tyrosine-protein kinase [Terriglobales bacterium]|nr:CpsD/CapB family tyrosine-protein kinase [Terriglobales bacterium]
MSRVFDALRKAGSDFVVREFASSAPPIDHVEPSFSLAAVPSMTMLSSRETRIVFQSDPGGPAAERYRLMRLRLRALHRNTGVKALLLTSPEPCAGKSTVALNLAAALAEKGDSNVLLLEGDLRRPSLAQELGFELPFGLTQCEHNDAGILSVIRRIEPLGFYLLPAGEASDNPGEILSSEWFSKMIKKLQSSFDWMLIDSPPVIPIVDTASIKDSADAILLVARAGQTQQPAIDEALRVLGTDRLLGIVLNGVEGLDRGHYEYYKSYTSRASNADKS